MKTQHIGTVETMDELYEGNAWVFAMGEGTVHLDTVSNDRDGIGTVQMTPDEARRLAWFLLLAAAKAEVMG